MTMVFSISGWKKTKNVCRKFGALHVLGFLEFINTEHLCGSSRQFKQSALEEQVL